MNKNQVGNGPYPQFFEKIRENLSGFTSRLGARIRSTPVYRFFAKSENINALIEALRAAGLFIFGFLFGGISVYGAHPFGMALLILSGRLSFFTCLGSALCCLTYPRFGFALFGVNTLIYIIRKLFLSESFSEGRKKRLLTALFTSLFIGLCSLATGLIRGEETSTLVALPYLILLPATTYLLSPLFCPGNFSRGRIRWATLFFSCILILSFSRFGVLWVSVAVSCAATLLFAQESDDTFSLFASALFGLFAGSHTTALACLCGCFVFLRLLKRSAITAHLLFAPTFFLACTALSPDIPTVDLFIAPLLSCLALSPLSFARDKETDAERPCAKSAFDAYSDRITGLSGAFGAVSKLCFGYSGRMKFPGNAETASLIAITQMKECAKCHARKSCKIAHLWSADSITDSLRKEKLTSGKLPSALTDNCPSVNVILDKINDSYRRLITERFSNNKTEILASQYSAIAKILKITCRESGRDTTPDPTLRRSATAAAKALGLAPSAVYAYGERKKTIDVTGVRARRISASSDKIASYFSCKCSHLLTEPEFILEENGSFTLRMTSAKTRQVEYTKATHTKSGETVNGDTVSFFESNDGFFYSLIADGMGSGRDAAMTSGVTAVFVEKLLSGGAGKGATLELLNSLLMSKSKECFSSVDLFELDMINGKGAFLKAGAAPAYLLRSTKLFKVSSDTLPCGIVEGFCAENTGFDVLPGDLVIMLSDGITSAIPAPDTICEIMKEHSRAPLEQIASKILDTAVSTSTHDDDMTCVIIKIK